MTDRISKAEFIKRYAERSFTGATEYAITYYGIYVGNYFMEAKPCDCGEDICEGWAFDTVELIEQLVQQAVDNIAHSSPWPGESRLK